MARQTFKQEYGDDYLAVGVGRLIEFKLKSNKGDMGLPSIDIADFNYGRQSVNGSVLVADGDKQLGKQLSIVSDKMGYDVVVRGNGERALDLFIERSFDVVFTALKMPGMDGLTLSLQVKATSLNTPVVLILDEHLEYYMNRIKAGRIDCVVSKPLSFGEIQKMVQYFVTRRLRAQDSGQPLAAEGQV